MRSAQVGWGWAVALGALAAIPGGTRAGEEEAIKKLKGSGGRVILTDEKVKGRPVVGIDLSRATLTEAGLKDLARVTSLTGISLNRRTVTDRGVAELRKLLPGITKVIR